MSTKMASIIFLLSLFSASFASSSTGIIFSESLSAFTEINPKRPIVSDTTAATADSSAAKSSLETSTKGFLKIIDEISPIAINHCPSPPQIQIRKRDSKNRYSIPLFFNSLPAFTVIEELESEVSLDEIFSSLTIPEKYKTYVKPTFGILTISEELFNAMNVEILGSYTTPDGLNKFIILRDVITLKNSINRGVINHLVPGSSCHFSPLSFRSIRVLPNSLCPSTSIMLPKGFESFIGSTVMLSMKCSEMDFYDLMNILVKKFRTKSFYNDGSYSSFSKIINEMIPLINCGSISKNIWYKFFCDIYEFSNTKVDYTGRLMLRWLLDRIFGDILKEHDPPLVHNFLMLHRYTIHDLLELINAVCSFPSFSFLLTEIEKMIDRNISLIYECCLNGQRPVMRPDMGKLRCWTYQLQTFFATHFLYLFMGDFDFIIGWIRNSIQSLQQMSEFDKFEDIENAYDLIELLLTHLNNSCSTDKVHFYAAELLKRSMDRSNARITAMIFKVFKEKSSFLLSSSCAMDTVLMKKYYYGHKTMVIQKVSGTPLYRFMERGVDSHSITRIFSSSFGQEHLIRGSLYNIIRDLDIKDPSIYVEGFHSDFSKLHCLLLANDFNSQTSKFLHLRQKSDLYYEGPSTFDDDSNVLSTVTSNGLVVLSERLLYSIVKQIFSRSKWGVTCFGILFATAKNICGSDIACWRNALETLVNMLNTPQQNVFNLACLSQIMRECYIYNVDFDIPTLQSKYTYRYMKKIMENWTLLSPEDALSFAYSDRSMEIEINLKDWAKGSDDYFYDFDHYSREHLDFLTSIGHLMFGIPLSFLFFSIYNDEESSLFEISSYLEYSLIRYVEFLNSSPNSISQKFKIRFVDPKIDEYERFIIEYEQEEKERKLMLLNDVLF